MTINQTLNPVYIGGFMRLSSVLKFIPVSKTTWWAGVKSGRYPKGIKLSSNTTAWKVEDIKELIDKITEGYQAQGAQK